MTKEQACKELIEATYNATRQGFTVTYSPDFTGQVSVTMTKGDYSNHTHAGTINGDAVAIARDAARFINGELN